MALWIESMDSRWHSNLTYWSVGGGKIHLPDRWWHGGRLQWRSRRSRWRLSGRWVWWTAGRETLAVPPEPSAHGSSGSRTRPPSSRHPASLVLQITEQIICTDWKLLLTSHFSWLVRATNRVFHSLYKVGRNGNFVLKGFNNSKKKVTSSGARPDATDYY